MSPGAARRFRVVRGLAIVRALPDPAVSVIKHNNPCGAASSEDLSVATRAAMDGDPLSAFGSVLGFNRPVDAASAEVLAEPGRLPEESCGCGASSPPGASAPWWLALYTCCQRWGRRRTTRV